MILQKAKMESNPAGQSFINILSHRIKSISLIHDQLYNLKEFEKVNVGLYTSSIEKNLMPLSPNKDVKFEQAIDEIHLNLETVTPLGLICSELISNSLKYNHEKVGLKVSLEIKVDGNMFIMHYHDNGIGYPEGEFTKNTNDIGHIIIQSLSRQLIAETKPDIVMIDIR